MMIGLLEVKILIGIATVLWETETDSKHFTHIDSCFSYQASQHESWKNSMGHISISYWNFVKWLTNELVAT
jgi:hypothetical protein